MIAAVDLDQVARVGLAQLGLGTEEAAVARFGRQPAMSHPQALAVVARDRPDLNLCSVIEAINVHTTNVRRSS